MKCFLQLFKNVTDPPSQTRDPTRSPARDPGKRLLAATKRRSNRTHAPTDTYYDDTKYI